ncbi:MerR family DNA-binding protein [Brevundimonas sp. Bb-A]|uniref:MerR family DNA-binding protein n=1 Tax=Brevundimonas sp. Bb-A TaxID=2560058 RepID=UPI001D136BE0
MQPPQELSRLPFIRRCRDLSFSVPDLRALISVMDAADSNCLAARTLARTRLDTVQARKAELEASGRCSRSCPVVRTPAATGRQRITPCSATSTAPPPSETPRIRTSRASR